MASLFRPMYTTTDRRTDERITRRAKKWYGQYRDAAGTLRRVPLHANKATAQLLLADLVRGVTATPGQLGHRTAPLAPLLAAWEAALLARGTSPTQTRLVTYRAGQVIAIAAWTTLPQLDAGQAVAALASLTRAAPSSKARDGISPKTRNDYVDALRSFGRWLVAERHVAESPFATLRHVPTTTDRRHDRRSLTPAQLVALLNVTAASPVVFRDLTGTDRHALYVAALATGFRAGELASLTPRSFGLDESPPVVRLAAVSSKNRRAATQPVPADAVPILRAYLADRHVTAAVWPGTWVQDASDMIAGDLAAAGIPYVVDGPDGPLFADFHALRHTFISLLDRPDVSLKQAMNLARHGDPRLTMRVYGRARLADLAAAADGACTFLARPVADMTAPLGDNGSPTPTNRADDMPTEAVA